MGSRSRSTSLSPHHCTAPSQKTSSGPTDRQIVRKTTKVNPCEHNGSKQCNYPRLRQLLQQRLLRLGTTLDSLWRWRHKAVPRHQHGHGRPYSARNCPHRNNDRYRICHPRRRDQLYEVSHWKVRVPSFSFFVGYLADKYTPAWGTQIKYPGQVNRILMKCPHRARDSPDEDEKEILSSTSINTREIWDGYRTVRQTGPSMTTAMVFDPALVKGSRRARNQFNKPPCLRQLQDPLPYDDTLPPGPGIRLLPGQKFAYMDKRVLVQRVLLPPDVPPNLTFNGAVRPDKQRKLVVALLAVGILIQMTVMVVNAVVVYWWRWLRSGKSVVPYGYPLWAFGTVAITLGTCICGWIVENSSWKYHLEPISAGETPEEKAIFVLFQKELPEQNIPAYAIRPGGGGRIMTISRRQWPKVNRDNTLPGSYIEIDHDVLIRSSLTVLGTVLSLAGFICQNIGTRQLHWSAGLLQFGAMLIPTMFRAWVRRSIGSPFTPENDVIKLQRGYPASDLATRLTKHHCYIPCIYWPLEGRIAWTPREPIAWPMLSRQVFRDLFENHLPDATLEVALTVLKTQHLLAQHQPDADADAVTSIATACYRAMQKILGLVAASKNTRDTRETLEELHGFIYIMVSEHLLPNPVFSREYKPPAVSEIHKIGFPKDWTQKCNIEFLAAIINLTRHAYANTILRWPKDEYVLMTARVLGHCTGTDATAYLNLLSAWIGSTHPDTDDFQVKLIQPNGEYVQLAPPFFQERQLLVFGLPLGYAFQGWTEPLICHSQNLGSVSDEHQTTG